MGEYNKPSDRIIHTNIKRAMLKTGNAPPIFVENCLDNCAEINSYSTSKDKWLLRT